MSRKVFCRYASAILLVCFTATTAHATNYVRSYVVNDVLLPTTGSLSTAYAIDVDGDGFPDNNIGQVLTALSATGLDFQSAMDAEIASGSVVYLVGLRSTDAAFKNDPVAQATWCIGAPAASPPKFDGTDTPSCVDKSGNFIAALSSGSFTSAAPATAPNPVSVDFILPIGASNAKLTVLNARISFSVNASGKISSGQINGSIPHDEMQSVFSPEVANECNASIQSDPSSSLSKSCLNLYDTGCTGLPAYEGDGQIELCEVTENPIIRAVLAPDVKVDDGGTLVDANSIGFRFTAIASDRLFANGFEL